MIFVRLFCSFVGPSDECWQTQVYQRTRGVHLRPKLGKQPFLDNIFFEKTEATQPVTEVEWQP